MSLDTGTNTNTQVHKPHVAPVSGRIGATASPKPAGASHEVVDHSGENALGYSVAETLFKYPSRFYLVNAERTLKALAPVVLKKLQDEKKIVQNKAKDALYLASKVLTEILGQVGTAEANKLTQDQVKQLALKATKFTIDLAHLIKTGGYRDFCAKYLNDAPAPQITTLTIKDGKPSAAAPGFAAKNAG